MSDIYQFLSPDGLTVIREITVESNFFADIGFWQRLRNHRRRKVVISRVIESKQIEGEVNDA